MWGAIVPDECSYLISFDHEFPERGFCASVRRVDNTTMEVIIEGAKSKADAVRLCEEDAIRYDEPSTS